MNANIDQYRYSRSQKEIIRDHNVNINIHKRFPRPAGYKLQATGGRLQATGYRRGATGPLGVSGYKPGATGSRLQATGCKLQATSIMFGVGPRGSFRYVGGLSESGDFQLHLLQRCCVLKLFFKICGIGKSQ